MSDAATPGVRSAKPFSAWEVGLAMRYLRAKRKEGGVAMISVIAFIGIMLAVAVLIIVMSVMNGFTTELRSRMLGFNGHAFVGGPVLTDPEATQRALERIRALPIVERAYPTVVSPSLIEGAQLGGAYVRGVPAADLKATRAIEVRSGSLDRFGVGEFGGEGVVLGDGLASTLGLRVGDPISLISPSGASTAFGSTPTRKTYTVLATFSVGVSEFDQAVIFMPYEQAQLFFGRGETADTVEITLHRSDPEVMDRAKSAIQGAAGSLAIVQDWRDRNASYFNALQVERRVMRLILMLIVAIAVMNIISGLIMLVKNKSRDIAILRTIGASQGAILRVFFMAGSLIGAAGTAAGLLLGVLFCTFIKEIQIFVETVTGTQVFSPDVYFLPYIPARVEWSEVALIVGFSLAAACLATLPTARRASRLDPVEALRFE